MTSYIGLYYPFIHFRDEAWLKLTSLYWDRMGRIVPEGYRLRDSDTIRALKDGGYIRDYHPAGAQAAPGRAFRKLLATHGDRLRERYGLHLSETWPDDPVTLRSRARHFGDPKLAYVFGPKMDSRLIRDLEALGLASQGGRRDPRWVGMHHKLANVYMITLAEAMAPRCGAHPVTDDTLSHIAIGGFTMERLAEALLDDIGEHRLRTGHEVEEQMAGLVLQMAVPLNLDRIPVSNLLTFRDRYAGERAAFQQHIQAMVGSLAVEGITDPETLGDHLQVQYEKTLRPELADLRRRLGDSRIDTTMGLANVKMELPGGLATVGAWMLQSGRTVLGTGAVALSVWRVWHDRSRARRNAMRDSPAGAYLYHLETHLQPVDLAYHVQRLGRRFLPGK